MREVILLQTLSGFEQRQIAVVINHVCLFAQGEGRGTILWARRVAVWLPLLRDSGIEGSDIVPHRSQQCIYSGLGLTLRRSRVQTMRGVMRQQTRPHRAGIILCFAAGRQLLHGFLGGKQRVGAADTRQRVQRRVLVEFVIGSAHLVEQRPRLRRIFAHACATQRGHPPALGDIGQTLFQVARHGL